MTDHGIVRGSTRTGEDAHVGDRLDRWADPHLRLVLSEYVDHYNQTRVRCASAIASVT